MTFVLLVRGHGGVASYPLDGQLTLGRAPANALVLDDNEISRRHALLVVGAGGVSLTDLGSANGTALNGERIEPNVPVPVAPGDTIVVGQTTLTLQESPALPAPPAAGATAATVIPTGAAPGHAAGVDAASCHGQAATPAAGAPAVVSPSSTHALPPRLAVPLSVVMLLSFLAFVGSRTVNEVILSPDFYLEALEGGGIFDKAFTGLLSDGALSAVAGDFFGGVDVQPDDRVRVAKDVAPVELLRPSVREASRRTTRFLDDGAPLDLGLDISPFIDRVHDGAIGYTTGQLIGLPTRQSASYQGFLDELRTVITGIRATGKLPATLPTFPVPPERRAEVVNAIVSGAGVDTSTAEGLFVRTAVELAMSFNDVESAIKSSLAPMLAGVTSRAKDALVSRDYVSKRPAEGNDFFVAPSAAAVAEIERGLRDFQMAVRVADTVEPIALAAFIASLAAMGLLGFREPARAARLVGVALVVTGIAGVVGWFAGRGLLVGYIQRIALEDGEGLPASFRGLVEVGIATVVRQVTPHIVRPCLLAIGVGLVLAVASYLGPRVIQGRRTPAVAPAGPGLG